MVEEDVLVMGGFGEYLGYYGFFEYEHFFIFDIIA